MPTSPWNPDDPPTQRLFTEEELLYLLNADGLLSYIVNSYWTASTGAEILINRFQTDAHLEEIFFLGKLHVFENVSGQHMILLASCNTESEATTIIIPQLNGERTAEPFFRKGANLRRYDKTSRQLFRQGKVDILPDSGGILSRFEDSAPLKELGVIRQGIAENPASIGSKVNERFKNRWTLGEGVFALRQNEVEALGLSDAELSLIRPYFDLCDIGRYQRSEHPSLNLIYSTKETCPDIKKYPRIKRHLERFRAIMMARRETRNRSNEWWHLHWPRKEQIWESSKILAIQMADRPSFVPAFDPAYVSFSVNVFVPYATTEEDMKYLSGLLNSRLLWKWFQHHAKKRGGGLEINGNVLSNTPIRTIDFSNKADKAAHDKMVKLVDRMLDLNKKLAVAKAPPAKERLGRDIESTDRQIDALVYELYGLTDDEIGMVQEATS